MNTFWIIVSGVLTFILIVCVLALIISLMGMVDESKASLKQPQDNTRVYTYTLHTRRENRRINQEVRWLIEDQQQKRRVTNGLKNFKKVR